MTLYARTFQQCQMSFYSDDTDTQSESSYDSRRRRKRWEKEQPFSPAQLNTSYDKEQAFVVTKQQRM